MKIRQKVASEAGKHVVLWVKRPHLNEAAKKIKAATEAGKKDYKAASEARKKDYTAASETRKNKSF